MRWLKSKTFVSRKGLASAVQHEYMLPRLMIPNDVKVFTKARCLILHAFKRGCSECLEGKTVNQAMKSVQSHVGAWKIKNSIIVAEKYYHCSKCVSVGAKNYFFMIVQVIQNEALEFF